MLRSTGMLIATIAQSGTLSSAVDLQGFGLVGLIIPTIDSGNVTFQVSDDNVTFVDLKDKAGTAIQVTATTGGFAVSADDLTPLSAYCYIKVKTSVAQAGGARTFKFVVKS